VGANCLTTCKVDSVSLIGVNGSSQQDVIAGWLTAYKVFADVEFILLTLVISKSNSI
jgi:hypothetical protein